MLVTFQCVVVAMVFFRAADVPAACADYERAIAAAGGVDVQILGVGANGHIGFNEPGSSLSSRTRIKTLAERTRADNARFFDSPEQVPTHCLTQGLGTIMAAREVVLVAQGASKADAIAAVVEGPVTASCPGSVLQFHEKATVIIDEQAAQWAVEAACGELDGTGHRLLGGHLLLHLPLRGPTRTTGAKGGTPMA